MSVIKISKKDLNIVAFLLFQEGNTLVVSGLHPVSVYRLDVHVITAEGEGPATSRTFQTPGYQSIPKQSKNLHTFYRLFKTTSNVHFPFIYMQHLLM